MALPFAHSRTVSRFRPLTSTIAIAAILVFFATITVRWSWNDGPEIIRSDATGYTAYLRAVFINKDLGQERHDWTYVHRTPDGTLNKYFAGEAVMLLPFFIGGHAVAGFTGAERDGLSWPYTRAISIAALIYALLGLLAFRQVMRGLGLNETAITWTLLTLGCGTQLVQYVAMQPGWSHVYSFCAVSLWLRMLQRLERDVSVINAMAVGVIFGLIVLIRPVNGLVLLAAPVVLGAGVADLVRAVTARWSILLILLLSVGAVVSIQSVLWYAQVGHLVAYGYKGEGFHWDRPEIFQVLFGVRRGLFVWTPIMLLAVAGTLWLWRKDRIRALALLIYWAVNLYVISSWWIWYYGSGWGPRVFIDHYPVLLLPVAIFLHGTSSAASSRWPGRIAVGFIVLTGALTMAQFYQYNHRLLHMECMDARKYAYSFMRFGDAHRDRLGGNYESPPFNPQGLDTLLHEKWDVEQKALHWYGRELRMEGCPTPTHVAAVDRVEQFGLGFTMNAGELPTGRVLYLGVGFERWVEQVDDTRDILCIATIERPDGHQTFYRSFAMEPMPPVAGGAWEHVEYRILLPAVAEGEHLKFYFWNKGNTGRFRADDLDMTVMAVRKY